MSPGMHQYRVIDGYAVIHSQLREWHVSAILFRMFSDFGCEKKVRRIMLCCLATHSSEPIMASIQTAHGGRPIYRASETPVEDSQTGCIYGGGQYGAIARWS
jgi:hypothetical protein